jgi:hypothetical protein
VQGILLRVKCKRQNPLLFTQNMKDEKMSVAKTNPNRKYSNKGVRGVLVNLELDVAEKFYKLSKTSGSSASRKAKELILKFVQENLKQDTQNPDVV